jgi:hypothetical protein
MVVRRCVINTDSVRACVRACFFPFFVLVGACLYVWVRAFGLRIVVVVLFSARVELAFVS